MSELVRESSAFTRAAASGERQLFFSSAGRPLYGAFHPAHNGFDREAVVVFCHAIGSEHMQTQRMEVLCARFLARAGLAAFRYNARAHGDSAGDAKHVTFENLIGDACVAADVACELSRASRVIWIGLRFGCLIAAEAVSRLGNSAALALWEPFHHGNDYFRSLMRATVFTDLAKGRLAGGSMEEMVEQLERDGEVPVVAGYCYRELYCSARDADLIRSLENWRGHTLIAQVQRRRKLSEQNERLRATLSGDRQAKVAVVLIDQAPAWNMLPLVYPQWTSEALLSATKEWLNGLD